ncbi:MAG TPA: CoA-binding protein [Dehalococcoidia bacterium]|nr:CoA-binding protein [Dehalococcoidia bacterium]
MNVNEAKGDMESVRSILSSAKTIAIVGLSDDWQRPSNFAAKYMQSHGYKIFPVNPRYSEILGEKCYPSLREIPQAVDIVDCFRQASEMPSILEDAIHIKAKCLWQQLGIINIEVAADAVSAGLTAIVDRCVKIEHARLFGGLNYAGVNTGVISASRHRSKGD